MIFHVFYQEGVSPPPRAKVRFKRFYDRDALVEFLKANKLHQIFIQPDPSKGETVKVSDLSDLQYV